MTNQTKTINISLILIVKNEEKNLEKNLIWINKCQSIKEMVVINDYSKDKTIETIKKTIPNNIPLKIINRELNTDFASQRNFAISKTKYDWILSLDADEKPSNKLINFLSYIDNHRYKNYSFKRQDIFLKHKLNYGETSNLDFIRLFNKNHGKFIGKVHEVWSSNKPTKKTTFIIKHYSHDSLNSIIQKVNFYSTIRAKELFDQKIKTNIFQIIFFPIGKFIQNYIFRLGFLDGTPGIIMALSMSFHVFLSKAKLWHLYQK